MLAGIDPMSKANPLAVISPCISVCRMNADTGLCEGCLRTLQEIAAWSGLTDTARLSVLEAIEVRRSAPATGTAGA